MSRRTILTPEVKQYLENRIMENGVVTVDEVVRIIDPYYPFDPILAKEREEKNYARRFLGQRRDKSGIRTCFAVKDPLHPMEYVDIEYSNDISKINSVLNQLTVQKNGLEASIRKAQYKQKQIAGQITFKEFKVSGGEK